MYGSAWYARVEATIRMPPERRWTMRPIYRCVSETTAAQFSETMSSSRPDRPREIPRTGAAGANRFNRDPVFQSEPVLQRFQPLAPARRQDQVRTHRREFLGKPLADAGIRCPSPAPSQAPNSSGSDGCSLSPGLVPDTAVREYFGRLDDTLGHRRPW